MIIQIISNNYFFFFIHIIIVGAVLGVSMAGTIFSNALVRNLEKASIPPDYFEIAKLSATIVNQLPEEVRIPIIIAYVKSLKVTFFFSIVPFGILCIFSSILMGNHKPKISKEETIVNLEKSENR